MDTVCRFCRPGSGCGCLRGGLRYRGLGSRVVKGRERWLPEQSVHRSPGSQRPSSDGGRRWLGRGRDSAGSRGRRRTRASKVVPPRGRGRVSGRTGGGARARGGFGRRRPERRDSRGPSRRCALYGGHGTAESIGGCSKGRHTLVWAGTRARAASTTGDGPHKRRRIGRIARTWPGGVALGSRSGSPRTVGIEKRGCFLG